MMHVRELTKPEQTALVGLARHLVHIDGNVSDAELYDLIRLGVEIGKADFQAALELTEPYHRDRERTLDSARAVERPAAREKIVAELARIAGGDGLVGEEERFIEDLRARWT